MRRRRRALLLRDSLLRIHLFRDVFGHLPGDRFRPPSALGRRGATNRFQCLRLLRRRARSAAALAAAALAAAGSAAFALAAAPATAPATLTAA